MLFGQLLLLSFTYIVINHLEESDTSPVLPGTLQICQIWPTRAISSESPTASTVSIMFTPAATSTVYLTTSIITIQVTASSDPMVQPDNENCGPAVIVVPIVVAFIAIVVIAIVVVTAIWWRRGENKHSLTPMLNSATCVVENDLYQSVILCVE